MSSVKVNRQFSWLGNIVAIVLFSALLTSCEPASQVEPQAPASESPAAVSEPASYFRFNADGSLVRPEGYRTWVYIGTPLTPNELNPPEAAFPEFHNVYIDPESWAHYESKGEFREGTIIIKELVTVGSKAAVSGAGYFMGEFVGLEATIKSAEHFPDEPGNWAYFSFGHAYPLAESAVAFPAAACNTCHEVSAADDFVFTQYYPVLRAAGVSAETGQVAMGEADRVALQTTMTAATGRISQPRAEAGVSPGPVPTDTDELFEYLTARGYEAFSNSEAGTHPSTGPHSKFGRPVRSFFSDELATSLEAGNASHPAGSSVVKEMYLADGVTLEGWAVSVKTQDDSAGGNGWFWLEFVSTTDPTVLGGGQAGNGVPLCTGCHAAGQDFVLSAFPD